MAIPNWTAKDFLGAFIRLLPRGKVWTEIADTDNAVQGLALETIMPTWARLAQRDANLLVDSFPATAVNLLPEWEYTLGLPDPCAGPDPLVSDRKAQVVARLSGRGSNMSTAFYTSFAFKLGACPGNGLNSLDKMVAS